MNALGIATLFVVGSIFLHNIKLFFSDQSMTPILKFNKVFQLANNKIDVQPKYYNSLYESYYQLQQLSCTQKFASETYNRSKFNQKILRQSLINQQQSFICTPNYLILLMSGVTQSQSNTNSWTNIFQIYKLPFVQKLTQISINGRIKVSKQCKQTQQNNSYQLTIITEQGPAILIIYHDNKTVQLKWSSSFQDKNYYQSIDIFDFTQGYLAYWQESQPLIVKIEQNQMIQNNSKHLKQSSNNTNYIIIYLLNIENQQNENKKSIQSINVNHIFIVKNNECIYLTVIYRYHQFDVKMKYIVSSSFRICNQTFILLSRSIVDVDLNMGPISSQCEQYQNEFDSTWGLSCFLYKIGTQDAKFIKLYDIFNYSVKKTNRFPKEQLQLQPDELLCYDQIQYDENLQNTQQNYVDDDIPFVITVTEHIPIFSISCYPKQIPYWRKIAFNFKYPILSQVKILKPSFPNPIIYYTSNNRHNLISFYLSQTNPKILKSAIPIEFYSIPTPNFDKQQERYMREISWLEQQNLVIIIWGGAIQLYQYQFYDLSKNQNQHISKVAILTLVEIFATIFCLVRTVWSSE